MKLIIILLFGLILMSNVYALNNAQRTQVEKLLILANGDKEKVINLVNLLNKHNIDLNDEPQLKSKLDQRLVELNIKDNKKISSSNLIFSFIIFLIAVIIFVGIIFLVKFRKHLKKSYSDVKEEKQDYYNQLIDFIKNELSKGHNKDEIKSALLNANWPQDIVDRALQNV